MLLSDAEYSKLVEDYGEIVIRDYICKLDLYIESKGKKYKSHNATIRNWLNKDNKTKIANAENSNPYSREEIEKLLGGNKN